VSRIRTLVVDDSVVARRVISDIFAAEDDFEVVGTAPNGRLALAKIERFHPHLITLDIDMPELDGLQTLAEIRAKHPGARVIMVSNLTQRGASVTVEALFLGASDYVTKASRTSSPEEARQYLKEQLLAKARALASPAATGRRAAGPAQKLETPWPAAPRGPAEIVVIGASTGGPNALTDILGSLPQAFPAPILIVQHLPANFTTFLARRLDAACALPVHEVKAGTRVAPGQVWIAPGDRHLEARRTGEGICLATTDGPPVNSCRPAADVLFTSAAECYGHSTLAVVLTGMGQDGLVGCRAVRRAGGQIIAQDRDTSVVWGMPGQVANAGLADAVLPVSEIGGEIVRRVQAGRR
jgi:two-component system chemotaxis response regulator CheB